MSGWNRFPAGHTIYHIDVINKDGTLMLRSTRAAGEAEDEEI